MQVDEETFSRTIKLLRFATSGAVIGIAVAGILTATIGMDDSSHAADSLGALVGFAATVLAAKLLSHRRS